MLQTTLPRQLGDAQVQTFLALREANSSWRWSQLGSGVLQQLPAKLEKLEHVTTVVCRIVCLIILRRKGVASESCWNALSLRHTLPLVNLETSQRALRSRSECVWAWRVRYLLQFAPTEMNSPSYNKKSWCA